MKKRPVYLDNASTTPLDGRVLRAMMSCFIEDFGNPSNLYEAGRRARNAVLQATGKIAAALHSHLDEIIFTGSATEADNLAIAGTARAHKEEGNRIIISEVEHKGIIAVCNALEKEGFEIIKLSVGKDGVVSLEELKKNLNDKTVIVSITMADSETGTLQPISEISDLIKFFRGDKQLPYFHTDASQAAAYANVDVKKLGVDLMTFSAHKLRGPKGIGALYVRHGLKLNPIIYGGGQQGKLRSGTENVPAIVGFGKAMELNEVYKKKGTVHVKKLRDMLQKGISKSVKKVIFNGHQTKRLPNFLNVSILDIEGESLLLELDENGVMVNTGSACNSESLEPSSVLTALGSSYEFVHGSIRFTLGADTTASDIKYVLKTLPKIVERLRKISPLLLSLTDNKTISDLRVFIGNQTPHFLRQKKHEKK